MHSTEQKQVTHLNLTWLLNFQYEWREWKTKIDVVIVCSQCFHHWILLTLCIHDSVACVNVSMNTLIPTHIDCENER